MQKTHLAIVASLIILPLGFAQGQSLGEIARQNKSSKKAARTITNDTLPEASGPANGAAVQASSASSASAETTAVPEQAGTSTAAQKAQQLTPDQQEQHLREQVRTVSAKVNEYQARLDAEANEASREAIRNMIRSYEEIRRNSEQELNELTAAKSKKKAVTN